MYQGREECRTEVEALLDKEAEEDLATATLIKEGKREGMMSPVDPAPDMAWAMARGVRGSNTMHQEKRIFLSFF